MESSKDYSIISCCMVNDSKYTPHASCSVLYYCRLLPVVIVMLPFSIVVGSTDLLLRVNDCSCWCTPALGNILPYAAGRDKVSPSS